MNRLEACFSLVCLSLLLESWFGEMTGIGVVGDMAGGGVTGLLDYPRKRRKEKKKKKGYLIAISVVI